MIEIYKTYKPPYDLIYDSINNSKYKDVTLFFNLGYLPDNKKSQCKFDLPDFLFNKNSIRLVLEAIGDTDLNNKTILDIGCGRGGTIQIINKYFSTLKTVGIDISKSSISYCKESNKQKNTDFYIYDASQNNFDNNTFDVATMIELQNTGPDMFPVYQATHRVLKKNGMLVQAGIFPEKHYDDTICEINGLFTITSNTIITNNVMQSASSDADMRTKLLQRIFSDQKLIEEFLIAPNNQTFNLLKEKKAEYRIIRMIKE